ncbi:hypothetical protein Tco_0401554 [Tanacetum coccineum]
MQAPESSKLKTPTINLEQESEKSPYEILKIKKEQVEKQQKPQFTIKSTDKEALKEFDPKSALYQHMHANKSFNRNPVNHRLYHALMEALIEDENAMDKGVTDIVKDHKRKHNGDEDDDDEGPSGGPNQGKQTERRRTKESESSKKPSSTKETPKGKTLTKGSKTSKSASAKEPVEEPIAEVVMDDASDDAVHDEDQPQAASQPRNDKTPEWFKQPPRPPTPDLEWNKRQARVLAVSSLEYNFQECFNALTDKLDWNNPEGDRYPFDLSKPLPLQGPSGHQTVPVDYLFNNDLEYLKTYDPVVTYTTSVMKTKAARYDIKGIEDMVPTVWSIIKHGYDKDALKGIKHWGERRKLWYLSQLYTFKEGDFIDLHLNDIEDMLLLAVQHKLFHLDGSNIVDFIMALQMFTRSLILKRRVKDLQLGVESYQKKLNITKPQKTFPGIEFKEPYTPSYDPPRIVYEDLNKQKRVLRTGGGNEL